MKLLVLSLFLVARAAVAQDPGMQAAQMASDAAMQANQMAMQAAQQANETLERRVSEALAERKLLADIVETTNAFVQISDLHLEEYTGELFAR